MAVLLSHKKIDNVEDDSNTGSFEDSSDNDKFSLGNVRSYFKKIMKNNSYSLEKSTKKKSPLPEIVMEFFTAKIEEDAVVEEKEASLALSDEDNEILLDDQDSNSSVALNSFTNLQLRLLNESLEEAEASFEKLVKNKNLERLEEHSLTFSFDDDSLKNSFGELQIHQIDLCEFEHEVDLSISEEEDESTDSGSDVAEEQLEDKETNDAQSDKM